MQGMQQNFTGAVTHRMYVVRKHTVCVGMDPDDVADFKARRVAHVPTITERKQFLITQYGVKGNSPGKK